MPMREVKGDHTDVRECAVGARLRERGHKI
jgi:hypothetical protein